MDDSGVLSINLKAENDEGPTEAEKTKKVGRKRGPIWDYFELTEEGKASCKLMKASSGKLCAALYASACPSSMEYHLEREHIDECIEFRAKKGILEKAKRMKKFKADADDTNSTSSDSFSFSPGTSDPATVCLSLNEKLTLALVCSGASLNFVNCPEVRDFIFELNSRYSLPHRNKIANLVDKIFDQILTNCKRAVGQARKVSICVDLWSRKNMKATFVGVSAHFFSPKDHQRHRVLLAVEAISSPHTAAKIKEVTDKVRSIL